MFADTMGCNLQRAFLVIFFYGILQLTHSASKDPYRWTPSQGKSVTQSSTEGSHVASFANDGDYNNYDLPLNYSQTTVSDNPYIQVDLGKTVAVNYAILNFPMMTDPPKMYSAIRVLIGNTSSITVPSTVTCFGTYDQWKYNIKDCRAWGRYVTVQSLKSSVELSLCEFAVHRVAVENLAYRKSAVYSSSYGPDLYPADRAVDMNYPSFVLTGWQKDPWVRLDMGGLYFIDEVLLWSRFACCPAPIMLFVRAGRSLENDGNSNYLCGKANMYVGEIRSFYCEVIARYINVLHSISAGFLELGEIVVNPETTENVAVHSQLWSASTPREDHGGHVRTLADGLLNTCHVMKNEYENKNVWIKMQKSATVYKVYIVNNPKRLDDLMDFDISIGPTREDTSLCLPGLHNMAGVHTASFFCEPRVTGLFVLIQQYRADKAMSICEIAVFEETKPMIDRKKDVYVWSEENKDMTLTCDAKGFPAPVVTWIRDNKIIQTQSNTLVLTAPTRNESGEYQCWANNTHGVDLKLIELVISSHLRVCSEFVEMNYELGKSEKDEMSLKGNTWYIIYERKTRQCLQFQESAPRTSSACQVWLNGKHPKVQDGVVTGSLCVKNKVNDCSSTIEIYIRRCAASYIYNFKHLMSTYGLGFCFKNGPNNANNDINPAAASPVKNHALSAKVFQTEMEVTQSFQCLMMCQLDKRCKSFNYSKNQKVCELNRATKKEFPGNYGFRADYDHYHMGSGMVVAVKREL